MPQADTCQNVLDNYYPPEDFTSDLDLDFETWSALLREAPSSTGLFDHVHPTPFSTQGTFFDPLSLPNPAPASSHWTGASTQLEGSSQQAAMPAFRYGNEHGVRDEEAQRQNNELNFGMAMYSMGLSK